MKKEEALKLSTCAECKRILPAFSNPETDFEVWNGHIFHKKLSIEYELPCLCGAARIFGRGLPKKNMNE